MKSVIMAGGMGTRVSFITKDVIPKPMLKIGEKPILEHQIDCLKANGIVDIIIVVGHLGNVIEEYFGDGERFGVHINYIKEKSISKQLHKDVKLLCQYVEYNLVVLKACCHLHIHHVLLILGFNNFKEYNGSYYHCLFRNTISLDHSFIYC